MLVGDLSCSHQFPFSLLSIKINGSDISLINPILSKKADKFISQSISDPPNLKCHESSRVK